jgi:hypothetical protein
MTRVVLLLAFASLRIHAAAGAGATAEPEIRVKAMFLYNFARFTEWPADAGSPLTFCVFGDDRLDRELETVLRGKTIADRALAIRHVTFANQIADCGVIYIGRSERNRTTQVVRSVQGKAVLVVSSTPKPGRVEQRSTSSWKRTNAFFRQPRHRLGRRCRHKLDPSAPRKDHRRQTLETGGGATRERNA